MSFTRRSFIRNSTCAGGALLLTSRIGIASASRFDSEFSQYITTARMAVTPASVFRPYRSKAAETADTPTWVQLDLGRIYPIDAIRIFPSCARNQGGEGFPARFKIEAAKNAEFTAAKTVIDLTSADQPDPKDHITQYPAGEMHARYVRFTATRLRKVRVPNPNDPANSNSDGHYYGLALAKIAVLSSGRDVAEHCPVLGDSIYGNQADLQQLTRSSRQDGEEVLHDNPSRITHPDNWRPVHFPAHTPSSGVTLAGGLFEQAMRGNIEYLLTSFSTDELLRQFYERAGKIPPVPLTGSPQFWEEDLAGSNAGRFLMGAGNTLRWIEDHELRLRLSAVVDGITACRQPNGYIMAYPEDSIFYSERGAYTRAWLTHGLLEAGYAGNQQAFGLLRGYYDWFNRCQYLPALLRGAAQGGQGMIANTRVGLSPVGASADFQVLQRYFQEDAWLEGLRAHQDKQIWQYPYDRPHCYLLTNLEAYFDLFRATGDQRYLDAVEAGWNLFHENWQQPGGSISIIEFQYDPPKSNYLHQRSGELCGTSFWLFLSQRFHLLRPDDERFVSEIEKSIYNIAIANLAGKDGFRYHTILEGRKESPTRKNSCCEGQGSRIIGSLPEHIYTIAPDGLYVNLYEPSTIQWTSQESNVRLEMKTRFPYDTLVQLEFATDQPARFKLRIRVPSWASASMPITLNEKRLQSGRPGSYVTIERTWSKGDVIAFTLPIAFRLTRYTGADQIPGSPRYSIEYGPILYAIVGLLENTIRLNNQREADDLIHELAPVPEQPLHYRINGHPQVTVMPYWQISTEVFTCFPAIHTLEEHTA
jgi:DUF1680 family protein